MADELNSRLYVLLAKQVNCRVELPSAWSFLRDRPEGLDAEVDCNVLERIETGKAVSEAHLEAPLGHVDVFAAQVTKLDVTVVFAELVDALACEESLQEVVAVADLHHWNVLVDVQTHGSLELAREVVVKVTAGFEVHLSQRTQFGPLKVILQGHPISPFFRFEMNCDDFEFK